MLQAFRRGLLKSTHTFGTTSFIREHIVLDTLGMEDNSDYVWRHMMAYNTVLAPHLDPKKLDRPLLNVKNNLAYVAAGYRYNALEQCDPEKRLINSSTSLVKAFKMLQKSGIIDAFKKRIKELDDNYASRS